MGMARETSRNYFRDLFELGTDRSASLDEKIERAITLGRDRLDLEYGVLSYTGAGQYEIVDSTIESGTYEAGTTHELGETWCRHVVADREMLVVADAENSPYTDDVARDATGLQCYIGDAVVVDGEVYGTLCYSGEHPLERDFTHDERRFVQLLTQWISYEIEREQHHQALDAQNERLTEFAGVLAHDLRNPLTGARGYTELVAESVSDPEATHLQTVLDSLDRMEHLITETLSLAREGADVGERQPVSLAEIAQRAWRTVGPESAVLAVENDRTIRADASRLQQLFENLFRNVDEHCEPGVRVTVEGTDEGFVVADDGPGLPPAIADSLFGGSFGSERRGLGLLIVERVVSGHGWDGTVETGDEGTRFSFTSVGMVTEPPATSIQ
ncbi:signal-transducing histidine kinase [Halorhabdus tiamatea SARL4B]|uniref:histidine kinase n=2 Tax=Halorhabdus tiamatea SARL4B TaxID=1033806 RepID=S6D8K1_9EURY|nr:signal-transducing histidine kinase [Halorhabdus tiamatea SARL4B]